MIVRINPDRSVVIVKAVKPEQEDEFLKINGTKIFRKVDSLPPSHYGFYKLSETGEIVVDEERELLEARKEKVRQLNIQAKAHILRALKELDWGETYEECLSELTSTAQKLLIDSIKNGTSIPSDEEAIKLLMWVEEVWSVVEKVEEKIRNASSFEELDVVVELPEVEL